MRASTGGAWTCTFNFSIVSGQATFTLSLGGTGTPDTCEQLFTASGAPASSHLCANSGQPVTVTLSIGPSTPAGAYRLVVNEPGHIRQVLFNVHYT